MSGCSVVDVDSETTLVKEQLTIQCDFCNQSLPSRGKFAEHLLQQHICSDSACTSCRLHGGGSVYRTSSSCQLQTSQVRDEHEFPASRNYEETEYVMKNVSQISATSIRKSSTLLQSMSPKLATTSHKYFCVECDKMFYCKQKLERHVLIHRDSETKDSINDEVILHQTTGVDPSSDDNDSQLFSPPVKSTPLKDKCSISNDSVFEEAENYELSSPTMHQIDMPAVCQNGANTSQEASKDRNHFICRRKSSLHNVEASPTAGTHTFFCPKCNRSFSKRGNLERHLKSHDDEKRNNRFTCSECRLTFVSKFNLHRHESLHLPCRIYACNVCEKTFANKYYLRHHMYSHSEIRKYICKVCDSVYKTLYGLTVHSRKHTV